MTKAQVLDGAHRGDHASGREIGERRGLKRGMWSELFGLLGQSPVVSISPYPSSNVTGTAEARKAGALERIAKALESR